MGRDHCAGLISASLKHLPGVAEVRTNVALHRVDVDFDPARNDLTALKQAVEWAGYDIEDARRADKADTAGAVRLTVPGMASDHCAGIISGSIKQLPGIAISGRVGPQGR